MPEDVSCLSVPVSVVSSRSAGSDQDNFGESGWDERRQRTNPCPFRKWQTRIDKCKSGKEDRKGTTIW